MARKLNVINPFFTAELGDTFELTEDGKFYQLEKNEEFYKVSDGISNEVRSSYTSNFRISIEYATNLIEEGYLAENKENHEDKPFVNVFDEIDGLIQKYTNELSGLNEEMKNAPMCMKVEKETVLKNIITVLNHLKNLKK